MENVTMGDSSQGLFADCTFTLIPSGLTEEHLLKIEDDITSANGKIVPFDAAKGRIQNLDGITYIVSQTSDFPDYYASLDRMIHVVKPAFIEASLRGMKIKNPRTYSPDPALFMTEVVICCGDIPTGDKEAIEGGVLAMGGLVSPVLSKTVTHLIALDIGEARCQLAISKHLKVNIVLPHWFDDCLKVGRRLSERPYTLPDPEILLVEAGDIPPGRLSQQIRDAITPDPFSDPKTPTPSARLEAPRGIKALEGRAVKLSDDLNLSTKLRETIIGKIKAGGGQVTKAINQADIYICTYRDGPDYVKASRDDKFVGNLGWLYYLIAHGIWTNPMRRLLHYPRPRNGIPGFDKFKISLSSYTGDARIYLENLAKASGAEFTKTFRQDNTHLVTAHKNSEKCEAAAEWGVNVVNHLWLEDSFAKCKEMPLTDSRYTYFPPRTNLGEVLGQTEIDRDATEKIFFLKTLSLAKVAKVADLQAPSIPASSLPPQRVPNDPVAQRTPAADRVKRTKAAASAETPVAPKNVDGKENLTPGSRGAKDRALSKLHQAAPDIAQFEKEMKRKGGVVHGGRRRVQDEVDEKSKRAGGRDSVGSKRSIDEVEEDDEAEDEATEAPTRGKRAKKEKLTPIKFRMLVSKNDRWTKNDEKASKEKGRLRELGLFITDDFKKIDLVCAPHPVRTKKFIAALACAPTLVSTSYLDYALQNDELPPVEEHLLEADEFEEANNFKFSEAIERAKQNKHRLLKNWTIFCSENVPGGFDTYKDITAANGGLCLMWKGRTTTLKSSKRLLDTADGEVSQNQEEDEGDVLYLISEPNKKEFANWAKFRELAKKHDMIPRIVKTEWLLFVAMAQYVHWDPAWELSEEAVKAMT